MVSAKGTPTDHKLKNKVTEEYLLTTHPEVKQQTNKDGSGKGQMVAWKAAKIGKEYEARGGDYIDTPGSKDKPKKGPPERKTAADNKPKANNGKKSGRTKGAGSRAPRKEKKPPREGVRKSMRQAEAGEGRREKRKGGERGEEKGAKKAKTEGK